MATYFGQLRQTLAAELPGPLDEAMGDDLTYTVIAGPTNYTVVGRLIDPEQMEGAWPGVNQIAKIHESKLSDASAPDPVAGNELTAMGTTYQIYRVDKDGVGFFTLYMRQKA